MLTSNLMETASANNSKFRFVRIPPKDDHTSFPSSRVMLNSVRIRPQGYSNHGGNARPIPRASTLIFSRRKTPAHCPSSEDNAISPEAMDNLPAVSDFSFTRLNVEHLLIELYRRWDVHVASEFGKGLARSGSAFQRGGRRRKGERREGEAALPKAENARGKW